MHQDRSRASTALPARGRFLAGVIAALLMLALGPASIASAQLPPAARPPRAVGDDDGGRAGRAALPPARSVLDRHLAAIGGREAVLRHRSTHVKGTLTMPAAGITGTLEVFAARPDKTLLRVSLGGVGEIIEAFDGAIAWSVSPMTGPMLIEGRQLEEKRFDADYDSELRSDTRYASITTVDRTQFDGRDCYQVRLVRATGGEDVEFYDVQTGLKAGSITTRETPMGTVTGTTTETDYRRFGGLLQPTTVRSQIGGLQQVITITAIEYDTVPAAVFELPADIKALLR